MQTYPEDHEINPACPNGCGLLHANYQNVGFEPPEGAPHYEIEDFYCPKCGFRIEDPESLNEN